MTTATSATIAGGRAVVEALRVAGVDHAFCVPGESFLGVLDALYDSGIRVIATRHEGGASFMAEAYAKLSRKPAVCLGTRAVGGGNLLIGLHTARQDSSPVIGLLGHVNTEARYREAFQESELTQLFAPVVKWAVEPPSAERLGELTLFVQAFGLVEQRGSGLRTRLRRASRRLGTPLARRCGDRDVFRNAADAQDHVDPASLTCLQIDARSPAAKAHERNRQHVRA